MSSVNRESESVQKEVHDSRVEELKWTLRSLPTVSQVEPTQSDNDSNLRVELSTDMVEPPVERALDRYDGEMKRASTGPSGNLKFDVDVQPRFEDAGQNNVRKRGGSFIVAIPPEAAETAGVNLGDTLDFESRDGEIRITKSDD